MGLSHRRRGVVNQVESQHAMCEENARANRNESPILDGAVHHYHPSTIISFRFTSQINTI